MSNPCLCTFHQNPSNLPVSLFCSNSSSPFFIRESGNVSVPFFFHFLNFPILPDVSRIISVRSCCPAAHYSESFSNVCVIIHPHTVHWQLQSDGFCRNPRPGSVCCNAAKTVLIFAGILILSWQFCAIFQKIVV